jgi:hypothetical protein
MRLRTALAITGSLLMAGCSLSEPPPRSGSPGAAVSQLQDVQACQNAFSLPKGWQVQAAGEQRWLLKAPASARCRSPAVRYRSAARAG